MLRFIRKLAEFIAAFLGVALLVMVLLIWRLSANPVNSTFLTPYIEAGIERYIPGAHVKMAHTLMTWDNVDHSFTFHADGVFIRNAKDGVIAEVPNLDIRLSILGLVVGQFWPVDMTIDHPQIMLDRHTDGKLYFAALATSGAEADDEQVDGREALRQTLQSLTHAYAMRHINVNRAVIGIHDDATGASWSVGMPELTLTRTLAELSGEMKIDLTQKGGPASLQVNYNYDALKQQHHISTAIDSITPSQLVGGHPETIGLDSAAMLDLPISGEVEAAFDPNLDLIEAATTLNGGAGTIVAPTFWDKPLPIANFAIEAKFDRKARTLDIPKASFDLNGPKLDFTYVGAAASAPDKDFDFTATVGLKNVPMDFYMNLWPKPVMADVRSWMEQNISKGVFDKATATFKGSMSLSDLSSIDIQSGQGKISASHAKVSYIDGMPPVEDVQADADFDLNKMVIQVTGGGVGDLRLAPFAINITGLSDADQYIDIPLAVSGPITSVLTLIDHPPLRYAQTAGLPVNAIAGDAQGVATLHFPLLKNLTVNDVGVSATAKLTNVSSTQLVSGVDLSQGDLSLDLDKNGFTVKGALAIDKLPAQVAVRQVFAPGPGKPLRRVSVQATIKDDEWKQLGLDILNDTRGSADIALQITQPSRAKTLFAGTADLTAANMQISELNWKKSPGAAASAKFSAESVRGGDLQINSLTLHGPRANARGQLLIDNDGHIKSAHFAPFDIGRTSANITFDQTEGPGGSVSLEADGDAFDISGMSGGKEPYRADVRPKHYHFRVGKLYTGDDSVVTDLQGDAVQDGQGWSTIDFHGLADGDQKVDVVLAAQADGTRKLTVDCDDFGKMLKGFGFTDTVKGGKLRIMGASTLEHPRIIDGTIDVSSFSVGKLPAMMVLLNATSPFGFSGLVTNTATLDHLRGGFAWQGDTVTFKHVNVAGSFGMNIDGNVDMDSGQANLNGTLVPFSTVNNILGAIPVIGDILTGGNNGGVLAVAYEIKGPLSNPKVSVNPVSLLTPGFLRNLFFGGDDTDDADKPQPVPVATQAPSQASP